MMKRHARREPIERFREKYETDLVTGCWNWTASLFPNGYSKFAAGGRCSSTQAHRWSFEYFKGVVPSGMQVNHTCENKKCVNPAHLEVVTPLENIRYSYHNHPHVRKTHCKNGHPLTPDNVVHHKGDKPHWRKCATCRRIYEGRRRRSG